MKARILPILAWMVIFGVAALLITGTGLVAFVALALHFEDQRYVHLETITFWTIRILFGLSLVAALWLGLRGTLPGTQAAMTARAKLVCLYGGAVAGLLLICKVLLMPPAARPAVNINFLGFNNGVSGSQVAGFVISNADSITVFRAGRTHVETGGLNDQAGHILWPSTDGLPDTAELSPGREEVFSIPRPTNDVWRVGIRVWPETRRVMATKFLSTVPLTAIGLKPKYTIRVYWVNSDWIGRE